MDQLALYPPYRKRVRIIDIDGTLIEKKPPELYKEARAFPFAAEMVRFWYDSGDYILLWTARRKELEAFTIEQLKEANIPYHELLMNKPWSHETHIYDDWAPISHKIDRNTGIGKLYRDTKIYNNIDNNNQTTGDLHDQEDLLDGGSRTSHNTGLFPDRLWETD